MPEFFRIQCIVPVILCHCGEMVARCGCMPARIRQFLVPEFPWFHSYGGARVTQVLQGSRTREIRNTNLSQLSTYGILKGSTRELIDAYLDALIGAGCIDIVGNEYLRTSDYRARRGRDAAPGDCPAAALANCTGCGLAGRRIVRFACPSQSPGPDRDHFVSDPRRASTGGSSTAGGSTGRRTRLRPPCFCSAFRRGAVRWRRPSHCRPTASSRTVARGNWSSGIRPIPKRCCRFTASARRRPENTATSTGTDSRLPGRWTYGRGPAVI